MRRRADRGLVSVLAPLLAFVAFGVARVGARVADRAPLRQPDGLCAHLDGAGALRVEESGELNASAGAAHLLFVTQAALRRSDGELEALLAHELGNHHGLHPVATAIIWWLSLPGEALAGLYRALRRLTLRVTRRLRPLAILGQVFLLAWQVSVMWLYYVGKLLAQRAARMSEYTADRAAAEWGYAEQLAALFSSLEEAPPQGRFARLLADHPPIQTRIEQLAAR